MLDITDFEKINAFKDTIQKHLFTGSKTGTFRKMVAELFSEIFQYNHMIFGYLNQSNDKELSMDVATHKLDYQFLQSFLGSSLFQEKSFFEGDDIIVFSEKKNYTRRVIYKDLMMDQNYSDFMLFYLSDANKYNGYIIFFKERAQGKFGQKDKQIIKNVMDYLGTAYSNANSYLGLKMTNDLLITQTEYYPIGIIMMKNFTTASFANKIAKMYLSELGHHGYEVFQYFLCQLHFAQC